MEETEWRLHRRECAGRGGLLTSLTWGGCSRMRRRLVRDRVREFVDREVIPVAADYWDRARVPVRAPPGPRGARPHGRVLPEEYGCAGWNNVAYGLAIAELARGSGSLATFLARPERARDDGHTRAGIGGAEAALAGAHGEVREDRLLRPDRTGGGERSWLSEHDGRREGRRLRAERREEVDRQRLLLGRGRDLGQDRRR